MNTLLSYAADYASLFILLSGISFLAFILSLMLIPVVIGKMPEDYFTKKQTRLLKARSLWIRWFLFVVINVVGLIFVMAGLIMFFIPGQGILTMVLGLALMSFPGKRRIESAVIMQPKVQQALNWIRKKRGMADFQFPDSA